MALITRLLFCAAALGAQHWYSSQIKLDTAPVWQQDIGHALSALATLAVVLVITSCLRVFLWDGYLKKVHGIQVPQLVPHSISIVLYAAAIVNFLRYDYGISVAGALAASGFIAIILGFALRSVILDLFSGLAISTDKSYRVGDWVTFSSRDLPAPVYGQVEDIGWRTTRLRLEDMTLFTLPNSMGGTFAIQNHSQPHAAKRLEFTFLLPHETAFSRVHRLLTGAVLRVMSQPGYFENPEPKILMRGIKRDGVEYLVRFFVDIQRVSPTTALSNVTSAVHEAILQNRLSFPGQKVEIQNRKRAHANARVLAVNPLKALKCLPTFSTAMNEQELRQLVSEARVINLPQGKETQLRYETASPMFVILSGAANLVVEDNGGRKHKLATLSIGDLFGDKPSPEFDLEELTVVAETELEVLEIGREQFERLLLGRPDLLSHFSEIADGALCQKRVFRLKENGRSAAAGPDYSKTLFGGFGGLLSGQR